jgi:hypothetical protein
MRARRGRCIVSANALAIDVGRQPIVNGDGVHDTVLGRFLWQVMLAAPVCAPPAR